jgi:hypothetical protein
MIARYSRIYLYSFFSTEFLENTFGVCFYLFFINLLVLRGMSSDNLEFGCELNKIWPIIILIKNRTRIISKDQS